MARRAARDYGRCDVSIEFSDQDLLSRVRNGDTDAFGDLYAHHSAAAHRAARRIVSDPHLAEDLVSESFARVFRALRGENGPQGDLFPYLLVTMRNVAATWGRNSARYTPVGDDSAFEPRDARDVVAGADEVPVDNLNATLTSSAFATLPARWRTVLWYLEVEGESAGQVGRRLGLNEVAVRQLAKRAREGLREAYLAAYLGSRDTVGPHVPTADLVRMARGRMSLRRRRALEPHLDTCAQCTGLLFEAAEESSTLRVLALPFYLAIAYTVLRYGRRLRNMLFKHTTQQSARVAGMAAAGVGVVALVGLVAVVAPRVGSHHRAESVGSGAGPSFRSGAGSGAAGGIAPSAGAATGSSGGSGGGTAGGVGASTGSSTPTDTGLSGASVAPATGGGASSIPGAVPPVVQPSGAAAGADGTGGSALPPLSGAGGDVATGTPSAGDSAAGTRSSSGASTAGPTTGAAATSRAPYSSTAQATRTAGPTSTRGPTSTQRPTAPATTPTKTATKTPTRTPTKAPTKAPTTAPTKTPPPTTDPAPPASQGTNISSVNAKYCVAAKLDGSVALVVCSSSALQQWKLTSGQLQLAGAVCMAISNKTVNSEAAGNSPVDSASGKPAGIRTPGAKAVAAVGYGVEMTPCATAGSSAQWHKQRASSGVDSHGAVMIASDSHGGLCLAAQGGRVAAGAALIARPCKSSGDVDAELFKF